MNELILILCAIWLGFVDGIMDTVKFHFQSSVFCVRTTTKFRLWWYRWSYEESWKNQYKNWPTDKRRRLIGYGPLIFLCDFWHFLKTLLVLSYFTVIYIALRMIISNEWYYVLIVILGGWFVYGATHDIFMKIWLKRTK